VTVRHELKTDPEVFQAVWDEKKNFEIRFNDRNFQIGEAIDLLETKYTGAEMKAGKPLEYTGRKIGVEIGYILKGPVYGLADGWVIMDISAR